MMRELSMIRMTHMNLKRATLFFLPFSCHIPDIQHLYHHHSQTESSQTHCRNSYICIHKLASSLFPSKKPMTKTRKNEKNEKGITRVSRSQNKNGFIFSSVS